MEEGEKALILFSPLLTSCLLQLGLVASSLSRTRGEACELGSDRILVGRSDLGLIWDL